MTTIKANVFRGMAPRVSARLLSESQSQVAFNCKLTGGRIDPLAKPLLLATLGGSFSANNPIKTLHRYRYRGSDSWLAWSKDVKVTLSPTIDDTYGRFYYTGDGDPKMSTYADAIFGGGPYPYSWYQLGVTAPITKPSVTSVTGGTAPTEYRVYVYTFVTQYGEESGVSYSSDSTSGNANGTWNLSLPDVPPSNSGTISAVVNNSPASGFVTVTMNTVFGLSVDENITIASVSGMTDLNGSRKIYSIDTSLNKVVIQLTTAQSYTSGGTWAKTANHNLTGMKKRIYRSAGTGATAYQFVAEISAATTTYADSVLSTALGASLSTLRTSPPPKDLFALLALPNGALAGLSYRYGLCISDQYLPHSWPVGNRYQFAGQGVALGASGNSVIVLTDGYPQVAVATSPDAATVAKIGGDSCPLAPCVSAAGAVDIGGGVLFPSYDGMYLATPGGVELATSGTYTRSQWKSIYPESFKGGFYDRRYYAIRTADAPEAKRVWVFDSEDRDSIVEVKDSFDAIYRNPYDGVMYVASGAGIYAWETDPTQRYQAQWRSKEYQLPSPTNMCYAQVHGNFVEPVIPDPAIIAGNTAVLANADNVDGEIASNEILAVSIAGSTLVNLGDSANRSVQFSILRDGAAYYSITVPSKEPFRLPSGSLNEIYSFEIYAQSEVYSVTVADSTEELRRLST